MIRLRGLEEWRSSSELQDFFPTAVDTSFSEGGGTWQRIVILASFTDQGIRNVKESPDRLAAFKAMAEKMGVTMKSALYTVGAYDMVNVVEGSDEAVTSVLLKLGSLGNIRTQTLRAFSPEEMESEHRQDAMN